MRKPTWRLDMGAQATADGVLFRVWAPNAKRVEVELQSPRGPTYHPLSPEGDGVFSVIVSEARVGSRYRFRLDGQRSYPDPYSRKQPQGVHGPSEVVAADYPWQDDGWTGVSKKGLVIYELHVGAFTRDGTFQAIVDQLDELRSLGVTTIELMPVAEFPGKRNWGYDGVYPYAPSLNYGGVDGLKHLVDCAHQCGLGVLLDVVYNHLGPSGNYLRAYSDLYFTDRYRTPWGEAMNYDGPGSRWVRHFVVQNACYWLNEYHIDGLRLDATHAIYDSSPKNILQEIADAARANALPGRQPIIIAENENNDVRLIRPTSSRGYGLDGIWADDFHHTVRTFLTGEKDGYYADYPGNLSDVAYTVKYGFLYQGQMSRHLGRPRGTRVTNEPAEKFIFCIQNHDQVGNRAFGERLNHQINLAQYHVASALLLLVPETPLLFMGQEFAASSPFLYFTDHQPDLGRLVTEGRREEFKRFEAFSDPIKRAQIPDPQAEATFRKSKLDLTERETHDRTYQLYKDLIALRCRDPVLRSADRQRLAAVALADSVLGMRRWAGQRARLALFNFGAAISITVPDDLAGGVNPDSWRLLFTTAIKDYGSRQSIPALRTAAGRLMLWLPESCAVVLAGDRCRLPGA